MCQVLFSILLSIETRSTGSYTYIGPVLVVLFIKVVLACKFCIFRVSRLITTT